MKPRATQNNKEKLTPRKLSLVPALFAISMVCMFAGDAVAACLLRTEKGGPILSCRTCTCDEMKAAGVPLNQCLDLFAQADPPKKRFDKIIRYSDTNVTLHETNGTEWPLASDALQKQFDEVLNRPDFKDQIRRLRASLGAISAQRLAETAKLLGVEIEIHKKAGGTKTPVTDLAPGRTSPIKRPNN